ncbi:hypothetical protein M2210_003615 [Bradyrhizobium elkanii]|nr:hypothetical protein [Bradyrhizobium elkanii]
MNSASASARLISAAFPGSQFLISITAGRPGAGARAEPGIPEITTTFDSRAIRSEMAAMIAAVVL